MYTGPVKMTDQDVKMIPVYADAEEAALKQARLDALMAWNGRGEIPAIVWDGMSQVDRGAIKASLKSLQPDLAVVVGLLTLFMLVFSLVGVSVGAAFWSALNGVAVGALTGIGFGVAFSIRTYLPYWRAPRPPRLGAVLRWSAEEMVIRQRARLEARGYQAGELTEVKQVGDLRVIEGGRS